ncbi:unnamed protein product, partial [Brassica oleracea]
MTRRAKTGSEGILTFLTSVAIKIGDDFAGSNFEHKEYSRSKLSCGSRHYIKASFNDRMGIKDFDQSRISSKVIAKSFEVTELPNFVYCD